MRLFEVALQIEDMRRGAQKVLRHINNTRLATGPDHLDPHVTEAETLLRDVDHKAALALEQLRCAQRPTAQRGL